MTFSTRYIYASRKKGIFCLKLWHPRQICERQPFVFCWEYQNVASNHGGICYRSWLLSSRVRSDTTPRPDRTSILASCAGSNLSFVPRTKHFCFVWWRVIPLLCCQILVGLLPNWQDQCTHVWPRWQNNMVWTTVDNVDSVVHCGQFGPVWFRVDQCRPVWTSVGRITWCGPLWRLWSSVDQCGQNNMVWSSVAGKAFDINKCCLFLSQGIILVRAAYDGSICVGHIAGFLVSSNW